MRERGEDTGAAVSANGYVVLWEARRLHWETEESVFQSGSVVSAIYQAAQRPVIRGNVSTAVLEIEVETFWSSWRADFKHELSVFVLQPEALTPPPNRDISLEVRAGSVTLKVLSGTLTTTCQSI